MKNLISKFNLRLSDLFLLIGFIAFCFFIGFGQPYMADYSSSIHLWAFIIAFVVISGCFGAYLYFEFSKYHNRPKDYITAVFIFLALLGVFTIIVQPGTFNDSVIVRQINGLNQELWPSIQKTGDIIPLYFVIATSRKVFFAMYIVALLAFVYIGLFIFPKRFKSPQFLLFLGYGVLIFAGILIISSYIMDFNNYINFFKKIIGKPTEYSLYSYAAKGFIGHRNGYGMALLLAMIFTYINHSFNKKWWLYLIAAFLFVNTIFSVSKTALAIEILISFVYIVYRLIVTYKDHQKRNRNIFIVLGSVIAAVILVVGISYISKGKVFGKIYSIIEAYTGSGTIDMRSFIWDNAYQLIRNGWWIIGRGFGYSNIMLNQMNTVNGDPNVSAHSGYVTLLMEGGIIYLLAYLLLLGYYIYISYKCVKKNSALSLPVLLGGVTFILYSFIETNHYIAYLFFFPMFVIHHTLEEA